MAGITITGGQPPRIARVDTGSERPTWIGDAAKLDEQKKNLNSTTIPKSVEIASQTDNGR